MDGVKALIVTVAISLFSCESKEEQLVGHWHEYQKENPDFLNCHKITDSMYSQDSETYGRGIPLKRGIDIKKMKLLVIN